MTWGKALAALSVILLLIGLADVPEQLTRWSRGLAAAGEFLRAQRVLTSDTARWTFVILGLAIMFALATRNRASKPDASNSLKARLAGASAKNDPYLVDVHSARVFVTNKTPEDLVEIFRKHSDHRANELTKEFIGKWFRVSGPLFSLNKEKDHLVVFLNGDSLYSIACYVSLSQSHELMHLDKGDLVTLEGRLSHVSQLRFQLSPAHLIPQT